MGSCSTVKNVGSMNIHFNIFLIIHAIHKTCSRCSFTFCFIFCRSVFSSSINCSFSQEKRLPLHLGLHNFVVVPFRTTKYLWETKWVFRLRHHCRSPISPFNTTLFRNSSRSQRLMKGHLVCRMKTWQQSEAERLALFSYQRDPQPARLKLDSERKSASAAEILGPRTR